MSVVSLSQAVLGDRVVRIWLLPAYLSCSLLHHNVPGSGSDIDGSVGAEAMHMRLVVIAYVFGATAVGCCLAGCCSGSHCLAGGQ